MRAVAVPGDDRLVGDEPVVAAASPVASAGVAPARDVALVRIRHADGEAVDRHFSGLGEVEDELVAVVEEAGGVDRLEVPDRDRIRPLRLHRDRLDPVDRVLEMEERPQGKGEFVRDPRVLRGRADVEEKGASRLQEPFHFAAPFERPGEVVLRGEVVLVTAVGDAEIVGREVTTRSTDSSGSLRILRHNRRNGARTGSGIRGQVVRDRE